MRGRSLVQSGQCWPSRSCSWWAAAAAVAAQPIEERIEYWRTKYQELKPTDDPRAARAHAIFQRVVQVAGTRRGWSRGCSSPPVIRGISRSPSPSRMAGLSCRSASWTSATRTRRGATTGWRLCWRTSSPTSSMTTSGTCASFKPSRPPKPDRQVSPAFLEDMRQTAGTTEHVLARELQADERGIIYAAMAGFNPHAIVAEEPG